MQKVCCLFAILISTKDLGRDAECILAMCSTKKAQVNNNVKFELHEKWNKMNKKKLTAIEK